MKYSGKNVLITGASKGIGACVAKFLAKEGLKVWINYRSKPELADALLEEIKAAGGEGALVKFDAADEEGFKEGLKLIIEADGELSYLVNNAGITNDKLALRMKLEDFDSVIETNLNSCFIGCRDALKLMSKKRFGSVVNISSIVGEMGNAGQVNYSASKGAMIAMSKSFAKEGASRNVRFNAITPGFIQSDMTDKLSDEVKEMYAKNIPLARFASPEEVAHAVGFLLSDYSSYITGEVLRVNGGLLM